MYPAVDHDWYLTRKAASARPLIEALERYRREHQAYPRDATALAPYVDCPGAEPLLICGWWYSSDGAGSPLSEGRAPRGDQRPRRRVHRGGPAR